MQKGNVSGGPMHYLYDGLKEKNLGGSGKSCLGCFCVDVYRWKFGWWKYVPIQSIIRAAIQCGSFFRAQSRRGGCFFVGEKQAQV